LLHLPGDRHYFAFDETYVKNPGRPILSLSFKNQTGGIIPITRPTQTKIPPFFSNLLPEGQLRDYIIQESHHKHEFFLLAILGNDLPGAIQVHPVNFDPYDLRFRKNTPVQSPASNEPLLRFSLAGVQLKFSSLLSSNGKMTIPVDGMGGSWIIKCPSPRFSHLPENEFVMLALARSIGIPVPKTCLIPIKNVEGLPQEASQLSGNVLGIERFDRIPEVMHMEDFAQVFGLFPEKNMKSAIMLILHKY
jgi:serine/threonine-protein kinase HipA